MSPLAELAAATRLASGVATEADLDVLSDAQRRRARTNTEAASATCESENLRGDTAITPLREVDDLSVFTQGIERRKGDAKLLRQAHRDARQRDLAARFNGQQVAVGDVGLGRERPNGQPLQLADCPESGGVD